MSSARAPPSSTGELLRSWSARTAGLCLGGGDGPKEAWQVAYLENLRGLYEKETTPFDVAFEVVRPPTRDDGDDGDDGDGRSPATEEADRRRDRGSSPARPRNVGGFEDRGGARGNDVRREPRYRPRVRRDEAAGGFEDRGGARDAGRRRGHHYGHGRGRRGGPTPRHGWSHRRRTPSPPVFRIVGHGPHGGGDGDEESRTGAIAVRAHRCVLEARGFAPLRRPDPSDLERQTGATIRVEADPDRFREAVAACYGIGQQPQPRTSELVGRFFESHSISMRAWDIIRDLGRLDPNAPDFNKADEDDGPVEPRRPLPPPDVRIVGRPGSWWGGEVWTLHGHAAILAAHSGYLRSALGWNGPREADGDGGGRGDAGTREVRLDSGQFSRENVEELLSVCYGSIQGKPQTLSDFGYGPLRMKEGESYPRGMIEDASYLAMEAASLKYEAIWAKRLEDRNVADVAAIAEENGARLLQLACTLHSLEWLGVEWDRGSSKWNVSKLAWVEHDGGGRSGTWVDAPRALEKITGRQLRSVLASDFPEVQPKHSEDGLLSVVLAWSSITGSSKSEMEELVALVRLPFVPVDSEAMAAAVEAGLVSEDTLRICRLFQTDGDFRAARINTDAMYRPRLSDSTRRDLRDVQERAWMRERFERRRRNGTLGMCRMFGIVNGRHNFEKIASVHRDATGNFICDSSGIEANGSGSSLVDFPFGDIVTEHMPTCNDKMPFVGEASLTKLDARELEALVAAMLRREDKLRLHPCVQAKFGSFGEDEKMMSDFVTALQTQVSREFNVSPRIGVELIRSATSLFPETAKLAHYVRHNRAFEGSLKVGEDAPDVELLTLGGETTTLWREVSERREGSGGTATEKPVLIVAASYT